MSHDARNQPGLPADFSVEDIVAAPLAVHEVDRRVASADAEREARGALWELDFALQEFDWLRHDSARAAPLVRSIVVQLGYAARQVERFPVSDVPLPDGLGDELAQRFAQLTNAINEMPPGWDEHPDLRAAYARLRSGLEVRGTSVD